MIKKFKSFFSKSSNKDSVGHIDKITSNVIYGWCFNANKPLESQKVIAIINSNERFEGVTGKLRKDLKEKGYSNGKHGFQIKIERVLTVEDIVEVFSEDGTVLLPSAGIVKNFTVVKKDKAVKSLVKKNKIYGKIESIEGGTVYGWFLDPDEPHKVFSIDLQLDNKKKIPVFNSLKRQHLKSRFSKTDIGGFEIDISDDVCDTERCLIYTSPTPRDRI